MNDVIYRQSAINAIENTECELLSCEWDELTNAIKQVPSAQQWIPVTERPPVREGWYNVTIVVGDSHYTYYDVSTLYMKDGKWHDYDCGGFEEFKMPVIAWMPLPEPYEGGDAK